MDTRSKQHTAGVDLQVPQFGGRAIDGQTNVVVDIFAGRGEKKKEIGLERSGEAVSKSVDVIESFGAYSAPQSMIPVAGPSTGSPW